MAGDSFPLSIVVIGRNQAKLLSECLKSIRRNSYKNVQEVIYVDTASSDDSMGVAKAAGVVAISIDPPAPSAAIARNVGWKLALSPYVLFLDGDTILEKKFIEQAIGQFSKHDVAVVCGHRRERNPEGSVYQRVFDLDWVFPTGSVESCGGDALMRRSMLMEVKGYNGSLVAGEEPELCARLRALGYKIVHLDIPMTQHELGIYHFSQYWRRCYRTGYAYAAVKKLSCDSGSSLWRSESRHNLLKGGGLSLFLVMAVASLPWSVWPAVVLLAGIGVMAMRTAMMMRGKSDSWRTRIWYGVHAHFQHIPMFCGQMAHVLKGKCGLIEYH